jgi:F-type H+-transporting ATPase subunit delta
VKASRAVAKSYAKALFELAKERGQTEPVGESLAALARVTAEAPALAEFLSRPWVAAAAKRTAAVEVADRAGATPLVRDFLALVVAHGRADHLGAIGTAYRDMVDADAGRVRARVRTSVALGDEEEKALAGRLGQALGGQQVVLEETVDPTLLGGFVAEVGSLVLDGSLDGQLARLRQRLASG